MGEAGSVEEALRAIDRCEPDLVLLDLMLPTMDGFSICREVRRKKPGQSIIMITAKGSEDDIVAGFKAGADDYVPKPFSLRELMARVEALLRRSGLHSGDERVRLFGITDDLILTLPFAGNQDRVSGACLAQYPADRLGTVRKHMSPGWAIIPVQNVMRDL